jgi:hypothetical protein
MKPWNRKFDTSIDAYECTPDYGNEHFYSYNDVITYWREDMLPRDFLNLVKQAFAAGYNRRLQEEENKE